MRCLRCDTRDELRMRGSLIYCTWCWRELYAGWKPETPSGEAERQKTLAALGAAGFLQW